MARHGVAGRGPVGQGEAWRGVVGHGVVWRGEVRHGGAARGLAGQGAVWLTAERRTMRYELRPITLRAALRWIDEHHRHNDPPQGWMFGVACYAGDTLVGVATAGRPVGPGLQDGRTVEITRVCTPEVHAHRNTCSRLYGALCRAAAALGHNRAITYTLAEEDATSVRAAGFVHDADVRARADLNTGHRLRPQIAMFTSDRRPAGAKVRWVRWLK